jgi:hypothetical protein
MSEISLTAIFPLPPRFERVVPRKHGLSFPESPAIFDQGLPEYNHDHESCQHKRCKAHLNKRETVITIAEKTTSQRVIEVSHRAECWAARGLTIKAKFCDLHHIA